MLLKTNSLICWCSRFKKKKKKTETGKKNHKIIKNERKFKREACLEGRETWRHGELWVSTVVVCFSYFLVMPKASRNDQTSSDDVLVNFHLAVMMEAKATWEHLSPSAVGDWKGKVIVVEPSGLFHLYCVMLWHTQEKLWVLWALILACLWFLQCCNAAKVLLHVGKTVAKRKNLGLGDSNLLGSFLLLFFLIYYNLKMQK